jgi:hypothetical protein
MDAIDGCSELLNNLCADRRPLVLAASDRENGYMPLVCKSRMWIQHPVQVRGFTALGEML